MEDIRKVAGSGKSFFSTKGAKKDKDDLSQSAQRTQRNSYFFIAGEGPAMKNNSAASREKTCPKGRDFLKNRLRGVEIGFTGLICS